MTETKNTLKKEDAPVAPEATFTHDDAINVIAKFITKSGFEEVERSYQYGDETMDFIAKEDGYLVFIDVQYRTNPDSFPRLSKSRESFERCAAHYLASCGDKLKDGLGIRFDNISLLILGPDRGFVRHHRNCLVERDDSDE